MAKPSDPPVFSLIRCGSALAVAVALLSACSKDEPAPPVASGTEQAAAKAAAQAAAQEASLAGMSAEELKKRAFQSMREQRLYAPAGDNAMEYYIALRNKNAKPDLSGESALTELMPYAVIAAEQAIGRGDFIEAERLRALLEKADPQAPALPRIADAIAKGKTAVEQRALTEATRAEQQTKEAEEARLKAAQLAAAAAKPPLEPVATTPSTTAPVPAPVLPPLAPVIEAPPVVSAPPPSAPAAPAPARSSELVPISTPQPAYPAEARRTGITGQVTVSFTVNTDGSVSNIDIVSSRPRGTFDRSVQSAVRRWKYQPTPQSQLVTRTFDFKL